MFFSLELAKHREQVTKLAAFATFHGEYSRPFECPYSKIIPGMTFHLKKLPFGTTLSRQIAKQHLSRFNNVFWLGELSFRHLKSSYKDISIPKPGPGVHGAFGSDKEWQDAADEYHAWMRQHILVSASSLLEVYVKSASTTALAAKPELVDKSFRGVWVLFRKGQCLKA